MSAKRVKIIRKQESQSEFIKREVMALLLVAIGIFYYVCLFTYHPQDPSFFNDADLADVANRGGVFGSYLASSFLKLIGGASYFVGLYFIINSLLLFSGKRSQLKFLDFFVFGICSVFVAVFLQLQVGNIYFDEQMISAGGFAGRYLGDLGTLYLGRWGVYLLVIFGTALTFLMATRLSLVGALNNSSQMLGRGVGTLGGISAILFSHVYQTLWPQIKNWWINSRERRLRQKELKLALAEIPETTEDYSIKINLGTSQKNYDKVQVLESLTLEDSKLTSDNDEENDDNENDEASENDENMDTEEDADYTEEDDSGDEIDDEIEDETEEESDDDASDDEEESFDESDEPEEPKIKKSARKPQSPRHDQMEMPSSNDYKLPPIAFLDYDDGLKPPIDADSLKMNALLLESKLKDFFIEGRVTEIHPGPVITMYEFQPAPGVKLSRINSLTDDLSLAMEGRPVRIVSPLPNKAAIGIEIPNHSRETVWLKDIICDDRFTKSSGKLMFALGKDIEGVPFVADLQKMPHLLVAGSTGSGKSVSVNTMICSVLYRAKPEDVRMIMIDPKMIELSIYDGIPHLLLPVVTDPKKANLALKWCVREMERRYTLLADINARNIETYNQKLESKEFKTRKPANPLDENKVVHNGKLPFIVIVIDEFADLMMVSSKEVEESVCRLAQKARACGMHVILATQRPSVDVITGIIKANFPSRISFKVTSKHDSRTIIDTVGAEHLLGMGDMLFIPPGTSRMTRLHGAYISEDEITRVVEFLKEQVKPVYNEEILKQPETESGSPDGEEDHDEFYDSAVRFVSEAKRVSVSSIQRQFRIGYNRASRIVEQMETQGIVSAPNHQGQRQVLVDEIN